MKTRLLVALSILAFVVSTANAQTKCKFEAKSGRIVLRDKSKSCVLVLKELEAVFDKRVQAVKNKDAEAQVAQVSPDYSATEPDGQTFNYEQIIAYIRRGAEQFVNVVDLSITIESLTVSGNEAIVDARQKFSRTQRLRDGNIHDVVTGVLQREVWVKTAEGWKLKRVDNLREKKILVDGKPPDPSSQ
jgi:ketosteroid isomerase-like protein